MSITRKNRLLDKLTHKTTGLLEHNKHLEAKVDKLKHELINWKERADNRLAALDGITAKTIEYIDRRELAEEDLLALAEQLGIRATYWNILESRKAALALDAEKLALATSGE